MRLLGIRRERQSPFGRDRGGGSRCLINTSELLDQGVLLSGDNLLAAGMARCHVFTPALICHVAATRLLLFVEGSVGSKASHRRRCTQRRQHR